MVQVFFLSYINGSMWGPFCHSSSLWKKNLDKPLETRVKYLCIHFFFLRQISTPSLTSHSFISFSAFSNSFIFFNILLKWFILPPRNFRSNLQDPYTFSKHQERFVLPPQQSHILFSQVARFNGGCCLKLPTKYLPCQQISYHFSWHFLHNPKEKGLDEKRQG